MSTYTAEDFAKATFARHPTGRIATRLDFDFEPWRTDHMLGIDWRSDAIMAEGGWTPVIEAEPPLPELHLTGEPLPNEMADILRRTGYVHEVPWGTQLPPRTPLALVITGNTVKVFPNGVIYALTAAATRTFTREPLTKPDPAEQLAERLRPLLGDLLGQGLVSAGLAAELAGALTARGLTVTDGGDQA